MSSPDNNKDSKSPLEPEAKTEDNTGASIGAASGAAILTGYLTNAIGGAASILGFGSPGAIAGSTAASMMSTAATTGYGAGVVSSLQSAGALFCNAVGGSYLVAGLAVAAPVAAAWYVGSKVYYSKKGN